MSTNASRVNNPMKVITGPDTRWSYANVWEPKSINGGAAKYSVSLIIPKSDTKTVAKIKAAIEAGYQEGQAKLKGNGRSVPPLAAIKNPLRDGDVERPDDPAYANAYFVNANSATAPGIVDADRNPVLTRSEVYSGVYGRASINFYAFNSNGNKGKVTEELLYDNAFGLENYIITQFGKALANAEEDAFLNGDGVGKPLGLFAAVGGGQIAETLTAALKTDDIISLVYALKRPYRKNASFIINDKNIAGLRKLKDNNGAYLWQPSLQAGEPDRLFGYAVHTSAYAPEDAIAFGDYKYYNIGDRGTRSFKQLNELFAGNGMIGYVAKERVDGKLILPEAVQILKLKTE